jgi:arsenate reductase-like glutaredoxin family protein
MKKIYYLSTCDTCKRILNELKPLNNIEIQDIKSEPITAEQLKEMRNLAGSYEALFSKRARLYNERKLKDQRLEEKDYETLLLEHYTFLKRPVILVNDQIFIGNSKKVVASAKEIIHS